MCLYLILYSIQLVKFKIKIFLKFDSRLIPFNINIKY